MSLKHERAAESWWSNADLGVLYCTVAFRPLVRNPSVSLSLSLFHFHTHLLQDSSSLSTSEMMIFTSNKRLASLLYSTVSLLFILQLLSVHISAFSTQHVAYVSSSLNHKSTRLSAVSVASTAESKTKPFLGISWNFMGGGNARKEQECQELLKALLEKCVQLGQIGSKCTEEERAQVTTLARKLVPYSLSSPAKYPITGIHRLIHTHSKGGSSGAIGSFLVGQVTQEFINDTQFINAVQLGPIKISLYARRKVMDNNRVQVTFDESAIEFLGYEMKRTPAKGSGVWKCLFVGQFYDERVNKTKLIRIIEAPSLFVLEQTL